MNVKHADLIRAALDGKKIQWRSHSTTSGDPARGYGTTEWRTLLDAITAVRILVLEFPSQEYRLEPKPDVVRYGRACNVDYGDQGYQVPGNSSFWTRNKSGSDNVRATFDGETGKLKALEIV